MSMSYIGQAPVFGDFGFQTIAATGSSVYTMNFKVSSENGLLVFLDGAIQRPGIDYSAGGNTINFADVVPVGVQIFLYSMGLPKSTLAPSAGSVGPAEVQAGLYATVPETVAGIRTDRAVNPAGLAAFVAAGGGGLGYGQTWQDVTALRAAATLYQNDTNKPIQVYISVSAGSGDENVRFYVNGLEVFYAQNDSVGDNITVSIIVPPGNSYQLTKSNPGSIAKWVELR